ncbi:hypothetical protein CLIB1423_09S02036 [[Candida] railenensis]|uniref:Uncharacterized protein n=1 Tax=[Candida] railenensis TaxID=45579 RepID=A0A9P0QR55_9ASCO|nr:hypothetical protein CLIB1423_09S02036 [[Candida] railenensis]
MIRKSYSLADERRKFEKQQQAKIQKRQKHEHKLSKLEHVDPVRLHGKLRRLQQRASDESDSFPQRDAKYLKDLKEDWEFIVSNGLHKGIVQDIIAKESVIVEKKKEEASKLWGKESVYFNPELNPLGKVPPNLPNLTKRGQRTKKEEYEDDPELLELGVRLPEGDPPMFYKAVQNFTTERSPKGTLESRELKGDAKGISLIPTTFLKKKKAVVTPQLDVARDEDEDEDEDKDEDNDGVDASSGSSDGEDEEESWRKRQRV